MKKLFSTIVVLLFATLAFAIPAKRVLRTLTQPDGTKIEAYLCGDEHCHFYVDTDGDMLTLNDLGYYVKATEDEVANVKSRWNAKVSERNSARARKLSVKKEAARRTFGYPTTYKGKKKGIVILVNFKDKFMKSANNQAAFNNQFNQVGYNKNNHVGSVHDYFYSQSYGTFDLAFDVIGPVTVNYNYSYYGKNDKDDQDTHPGALVIEACKLANTQVNFKDYDWDGDGEVDQVYIIYAGYGEHASGDTNAIWPHEFDLESCKYYGDGSGPLTLDGVKINTYAMSCELRGDVGSTMDGIGTACHEFSHCLGIPDLYDTEYSGGFGMNAWDLMDAGSYNGYTRNGEAPCGFSAYEREFAGWLTLKELKEPCTITDMPSLLYEPVAYKICNDKNKNEYFVIENRQNDRWYAYVTSSSSTVTNAHGLLIYHVDYDENAWVNNTVNNSANHQRMSIVPADGSFGTFMKNEGMYSVSAIEIRGDLFPGTKKVTEFTNTSHANCGGKLFNRNSSGTYTLNKPITDITESSDGLISFTFNGGEKADDPSNPSDDPSNPSDNPSNPSDDPSNPSGDDPSNPSGGDDEPSLPGDFYLEETMGSIVELNPNDDLYSKFDTYFNHKGWKGEKVYGEDYRVRMASGKSDGYLLSPAFTTSSSTLVVSAKASNYNADSSTLNVSLISNGSVKSTKSEKLSADAKSYTFTFTNVPSEAQIRFDAKAGKRMWLYYIGIGKPAEDTGLPTLTSTKEAEFFTLSGTKVSAPKAPGIYIVKQGGTTRKTIVR